jgi:hypothetical protein
VDTRDIEAQVQRLIGYHFIVTSGVAPKGPFLDFNSGQRQLRIWIKREGTDVNSVAEIARTFMRDTQGPAYKQVDYAEGETK